jgi:hypothetical protein
MPKREMLCHSCRRRVLKRFPHGTTIYVGSKNPVDHKRLARLLKLGARPEDLSVVFRISTRRIQQLAVSFGCNRPSGYRGRR